MRATVSFDIHLRLFVATIKYSEFNKILADEFKTKKPSEALV
jgi:hypothetical protein